MRIVIDISDELYRILKKNEVDIRYNRDALKLAVIDGAVIPKCHGRLVDIDNLYAQRVESNNPFFTIPELGEVVPVDAIENYATTILASDKGAENEN